MPMLRVLCEGYKGRECGLLRLRGAYGAGKLKLKVNNQKDTGSRSCLLACGDNLARIFRTNSEQKQVS